jgi:hypothetical protein
MCDDSASETQKRQATVGTNVLSDERGQTAIHYAVMKRDCVTLKSLLEKGEKTAGGTPLIDVQRSDGATALLLAARLRDFEMMRLLLRSYANPKITAHGWRWDAKAEAPCDNGSRELRRVQAASPLMVAVMTALDGATGPPSERNSFLAITEDPIIRALLFCGGNTTDLGDGMAEAKEDLGEVALLAMKREEMVAMTGEDGAGGNVQALATHMRNLLGFDPIQRRGGLPALAAEIDGSTEAQEARLAVINGMVAARHAGVEATAVDPERAVLAEMLHQLGTAGGAATVLSRLSDVTDSLADGQPLGAYIGIARFLTQSHASTTVATVGEQAKDAMTKLCVCHASELGVAALTSNLRLTRTIAAKKTRPAIQAAVREELLALESVVMRRSASTTAGPSSRGADEEEGCLVS